VPTLSRTANSARTCDAIAARGSKIPSWAAVHTLGHLALELLVAVEVVDADAGPALRYAGSNLIAAGFNSWLPLDGHHAWNVVAMRAAQQLVAGHAEALAHNVVQRDVDGTDGSSQCTAALEVLGAVCIREGTAVSSLTATHPPAHVRAHRRTRTYIGQR
jgi:hypothetical protein